MHIERLAIQLMLAGGISVACGGPSTQEPPPKVADSPAAGPVPAPESPPPTTAAAATNSASDPKAICAQVTSKPATSGLAPATAEEETLVRLEPPRPPFRR